MNQPWLRRELLQDCHDLNPFRCGLDEVDSWLQRNARSEHTAGRVRTHVCVDAEGSVVAFFALKHIVVNLVDASTSMRRRADSSGMAAGLLLAQMGVTENAQGRGAGDALLREVFCVASDLHHRASYGFLVTDAATDRLIGFYAERGFTRIGNEQRLVMKSSTVNKLADRLKQPQTP